MNAKEKRKLAKKHFQADTDPDKPKNGLTYIGQNATAKEFEAYYNGASFRESFPRFSWRGIVNPQPLEADQGQEALINIKPTVIKTNIKIIKKDPVEVAFHLANGLTCKFVPRPGSEIQAEFIWSEKLDRSTQDYVANRGVPVLSFAAAWRHINEQIKMNRKRSGGNK